MKGIALVILALLVVLNEGGKKGIKKPEKPLLKVIKSCPVNQKLEAIRKILGPNSTRSREKRSVSKYLINNKFVDVLWFKYLLLRDFDCQFASSIRRADYNDSVKITKVYNYI